MKKLFFILAIIVAGCEDSKTKNESSELTFISSEGNFGSSNGSISVYKGEEEIQKIKNIGDVLQSILVHKNKLFAAINNSHMIKIFNISEDGLALPGIAISTKGSGPREMAIVGNKLYFTNWNTQDVKIFNLTTYIIEDSIKVNGMPEGILFDGKHLWVAVSMNSDYSAANTVVKIDLNSKSITQEYTVGKGPHALELKNDILLVTTRYYDKNYETFIGSSAIDINTNKIEISEYGKGGAACAGDILIFNQALYRTFDGGAVPLNFDASIILSEKIGSYGDKNLYSAFANEEYIFFGLTDYKEPDTVKVHGKNGQLLFEIKTGASPGDFATWVNTSNN